MNEKKYVIYSIDELTEKADEFVIDYHLPYHVAYECARAIAESSVMINDGYAYLSPNELLYECYWIAQFCGNFDLSELNDYDGMCAVYDTLREKIELYGCELVSRIYDRIRSAVIHQYDPVRVFGNEIGRVLRDTLSTNSNEEIDAMQIAADKLIGLVRSYKDLTEVAVEKTHSVPPLNFAKK